MTDISIYPIPAFNDNYIWAIVNGVNAVVVDPGQAEPVLAFLAKRSLSLQHILITHHHQDHTGGVATLVEQTQAKVTAPKDSPFQAADFQVTEGDEVVLSSLNMRLQVIATPGHTLDHICYFTDGILFCGDTLFSGGCGRLFEGSAQQMWQSLEKLKALPDETQVFCAHEYTQSNLLFAAACEPENTYIRDYQNRVRQQRENQLPSLPSTLALEKKVNPILRVNQPTVVKSAINRATLKTNCVPSMVFAVIRQWKDVF